MWQIRIVGLAGLAACFYLFGGGALSVQARGPAPDLGVACSAASGDVVVILARHWQQRQRKAEARVQREVDSPVNAGPRDRAARQARIRQMRRAPANGQRMLAFAAMARQAASRAGVPIRRIPDILMFVVQQPPEQSPDAIRKAWMAACPGM